MNKKLYTIAINTLQEAYNKPQKSKVSTQWSTFVTSYKGEPLQVLAIPGTNGIADWFWNLLLLQKDGVKYGCWVSAQRILKDFIRKPNIPLLITCHSKSGGTGIYLQELLNAEYCVAFCPARSFTEDSVNKNTVMFFDNDDLVPKVGWSRFTHRKTEMVYLPKDKKWWNLRGRIKDHLLDHIKQYIEEN